MEFKMDDLWRMFELIGIPLFIWMERRTTQAQTDAQWARATAEQAHTMAKDSQAALEKLRGEQAVMASELLSKVESVSVALARIEGRLQAAFDRANHV